MYQPPNIDPSQPPPDWHDMLYAVLYPFRFLMSARVKRWHDGLTDAADKAYVRWHERNNK